MEQRYSSVRSLVANLRPEKPLHIYRPRAVEEAAQYFLNNFNGRVLYAVKTNPDRQVLKHLYSLGITSFDVASLHEVRTVHELLPDAELFFMHTVKSRAAIRSAYFEYGVRSFSLDSDEELYKILAETDNATDLNLFVRLAIPNTYAEMNLADKFGVNLTEAAELLELTRANARRLGVCFHVGSQCMHSDAYRIAMRMAKQVIDASGVTVDSLDVGGGYPSIYPGMNPPAIHTYLDAIEEEFSALYGDMEMELMCEPGRALVAESGAVIVRVDLRKGQNLYINDGTYGSLFDAGQPKFIFPVRLIRPNAPHSTGLMPFSFFGPTCDTLDFMKGPFYLPEDISEGDYIEIGQLGAYGRTLGTSFNGFTPEDGTPWVDEAPLMSMYGAHVEAPEVLEIAA
ncbi:MAG: type III PLP-dependent enzyme [Rickettsiales bacterium]|nr:type III PLP-dependent enzyme [Rickettsiales bacterium]